MKRLFISILFPLSCLMTIDGKKVAPQPSMTKQIPNVSYCEMLEHPEIYEGRLIRVRGSYRSGFEISALYGRECQDAKDSAWLELEVPDKLCTGSKKIETSGCAGKITNVLVVGRFYGAEGHYGHLRAYRYKFVVHCVEESEMKSIPITRRLGAAQQCAEADRQ